MDCVFRKNNADVKQSPGHITTTAEIHSGHKYLYPTRSFRKNHVVVLIRVREGGMFLSQSTKLHSRIANDISRAGVASVAVPLGHQFCFYWSPITKGKAILATNFIRIKVMIIKCRDKHYETLVVGDIGSVSQPTVTCKTPVKRPLLIQSWMNRGHWGHPWHMRNHCCSVVLYLN